MKKVIIFTLSIFWLLTFVNAQHETEMFQLKFGVGTSLFKTVENSELIIGGITFTDVDTITTSSVTIPFNILIGVRDRWSIGPYGRIGNYSLDSTDTDARKDKIYSFGMNTEIYFINSSFINAYIGGGAHFTMLTMYETTSLISSEYKYVGWGPTGNLGVNIFFIPVLGLNLNLGYEGQSLGLNEWFINDNPQSMDNIEVKLKSKGFHISGGLTLMF